MSTGAPFGADAVAEASAAAWEQLVASVPGAWTRRAGGAVAAVTGAPLSSWNGVWGIAAAVEPGAVATLLDEVAASGVPFSLQLRPGWPEELADVARARGLVQVEGEPIMVLDDPTLLDAAAPPEALSIRQVGPDDALVHAEVAEAGFEIGRAHV